METKIQAKIARYQDHFVAEIVGKLSR